MKTKDNLHPLMRELIAPWAPLTYADHYYVDLGYRHELGKVSPIFVRLMFTLIVVVDF